MLPGVYNNNVQFFQTEQHIAIFNEMIHDARIVPMDGRPHGSIRQWMGDSRGHWEGATLVVDTVNFSEKANFRGSDENLHLIERFTRVAADTIEYRFTVDDPTIWTRSWTASFPLRKTEGPATSSRVTKATRAASRASSAALAPMRRRSLRRSHDTRGTRSDQ